MVCGPCALGKHADCTGFLRTEFGFCRCADRDHRDDQQLREQNETTILRLVRDWLTPKGPR